MSIDVAAVEALAGEVLDWRFKAVPAAAWGHTVGAYAASRPPIADLGTPLLTLDRAALDHNLATMAAWCAAAGVDLAPHGKTTMAPALWRRQLDAGAWAITLATVAQLRVARAFGVRRLHLANGLLDPAGLAWIGAELDRDPEFEFCCWVDSRRGVELMDAALTRAGVGRAVDVCVELGGPGGRTGCRDDTEAVAIADAVGRTLTLRLAGVAGYEGSLAHDAGPDSLRAVETYLRRLARLATAIDAELVTAGGSAYFDQVARVLGPLAANGTRVVLRSGSYLIHDSGFYDDISPLRRAGATPLRAAMHGWARVLSHPEPRLALLDGGKRDFPFDEGLPLPLDLPGAAVTALNDQHAYLRLPPGTEVDLGEVVRLGLSHPCTAFDKWALIPVVEDGVVVDFVRTFFG